MNRRAFRPVEVDASHADVLSRPAAVEDLVEQADRGTR